jgi:hypothetical protein
VAAVRSDGDDRRHAHRHVRLLGINLSAQDVAEAIVAAVDTSGVRKTLHQVHFRSAARQGHECGVPIPAGAVNRLINKRLSQQ